MNNKIILNYQFPSQETTVMIPGAVGDLEANLVGPTEPVKIIGIVCHPHPLYGGTMNNKVVTTVARALKNLGLGVVRFNFRGIGKSAGSYAEAKGEIDDLIAVIHWVKQQCPEAELWLAGFSFGSYIAAKVTSMNQFNVKKLLLIAPPVNHFPFTDLPQINCPIYIFQGDQDEVVLAAEVYQWANSLNPQPQVFRFPAVTHFFHQHLNALRDAIEKLKGSNRD